MSNLASAIAYVERLDFAVFPTGAQCKPGSVRKWFGDRDQDGRFLTFTSHDGTKDLALIRSIWTRWPAANVSASTGAPSGVFVLDIDAKGKVNGFEALAALEADNAPLPRTWRALTPSEGEHRYFRQPAAWAGQLRNKVGLRTYDSQGRRLKVYNGLDIRTDGGAIALPPSEKPHGAYRWADKPSEVPLADAPLWLLKLAVDPPPPPKADRAPLRRDSSARMARYVEKAIDGECGDVAKTKSGRNQQLFISSARLGELVGAGILPQTLAERELYAAAQQCGLVSDDGPTSVNATIASGLKVGIANPREIAE